MGRIFFDEVFRSFAQFLIGLFLYLLPLRPTTAKSLQSCPTLCDPVDCSLPDSSVHGILQARIPEWVAIPFSRDLPDPGIEPRSLALQVDDFVEVTL